MTQLSNIRRDPPRIIARAKGMLLAARKKRQGQNRLSGLILYDHH